MEHPERPERIVDGMAALHSDERRDLSALEDRFDVIRREGQLERVGIPPHHLVDDVDLLEGGSDGGLSLELRVHVDRPELPAQAARSKASDVGHDGRLGLLEVQLVEVPLRLVAERHREVVVSVDERGAFVQRTRAFDKRRIRGPVLGHRDQREKDQNESEWSSHQGSGGIMACRVRWAAAPPRRGIRATTTEKTSTGRKGDEDGIHLIKRFRVPPLLPVEELLGPSKSLPLEFGLDWSEMPALGLQNEISLNYPEPRTMLQAFVVTLREGLEAFLIVAISLAYLKKTGRAALIPAVRWGIVASVLLSVGAGILLSKAANQALWEGVLALVAAVLVASLTVHMWRAGRHMKRDIEGRLEASSVKVGAAAFLGVFMFTLLMITREGMETALLMNALLFTVQSPQIVSGAIGGTILAAFVAWLWSRYGHRVNLARFFQVTAVFLLIFVVQLLIYGFHELTEANIFPNSQPWHDATEPFGPDGIYGQYLTYLLVLLPLTWLAVSSFFHRGGPPRSQTA